MLIQVKGVAPMCSPSAAHRVFAITELLEKIILEVIHVSKSSETLESGQAKTPLTHAERYRKSFITESFVLKRVSRGFMDVIVGSSKIQNKVLTPDYTQNLSSWLEPSMHRIWWMGETITDLIWGIEQHLNRLCIRNAPKRGRPFSSRVEPSWRKIPCLQRDMDSFMLELSETPMLRKISGASPKKLQIDEDTTLGEVYDEMVAMQIRGSETERASRTAK